MNIVKSIKNDILQKINNSKGNSVFTKNEKHISRERMLKFYIERRL